MNETSQKTHNRPIGQEVFAMNTGDYVTMILIEFADGSVLSIDDNYMINQIEGLLGVTSHREEEEVINMLNEVDKNE